MLTITVSQGSAMRQEKNLDIFPTRVNKAWKHQISLKSCTSTTCKYEKPESIPNC